MHRTARRPLRAALAAVAALALTVPTAALASDAEGHPEGLSSDASRHEAPGQEGRSERTPGVGAPLSSVEGDCYEFNEVRAFNASRVPGLVPDRYTLFVNSAGRNTGVFIDYVCESLSIDGTPPRRTIVSMFAATLVRPTGYTGVSPFVVLWHGTDNPLLVNRLRQLGVDSEYLPESTSTRTTLEDGRSRYAQAFVGGGLDYQRTFTVAEPTGAGVDGGSGLFLFPGRLGDVSFTYANSGIRFARGSGVQVFAPGSFADRLGIVSGLTVPATFARGSWQGTYQLRAAQWPAS